MLTLLFAGEKAVVQGSPCFAWFILCSLHLSCCFLTIPPPVIRFWYEEAKPCLYQGVYLHTRMLNRLVKSVKRKGQLRGVYRFFLSHLPQFRFFLRLPTVILYCLPNSPQTYKTFVDVFSRQSWLSVLKETMQVSETRWPPSWIVSKYFRPLQILGSSWIHWSPLGRGISVQPAPSRCSFLLFDKNCHVLLYIGVAAAAHVKQSRSRLSFWQLGSCGWRQGMGAWA